MGVRSLAIEEGAREVLSFLYLHRRRGHPHPLPLAPSRGKGFCLLLFSITLFAASPVVADPPIWHVASGKTDITLFGSVHLLSADTTWLTPALAHDLADADALWFEIPIDAAGQAEAAQLAVQRGLLPADQTLSATVGPTVWAKVERTAEDVHLPLQNVQRLKPWLAELTLSVLDFQGQGARADLGVEQQLAKAAPPTARREAFETVAEQIGFFADAPMADQIESLNETLDEIHDDPDEFKRLAADWARGDVHAIEVEALGPMKREAPDVYQRLLVDRNKRFAQRIEALLRDGADGQAQAHILIVVGVGHLVGADSVPALLRKDGFRVQGP
jgi:uncharacterized protein YbaP (TraB family)